MFVSINKMIYVSRRKSQSWLFLRERVIFQECCCYWDDGGIGESPNGSMVTTPISPVRIYCACGRSAVSGGEGGDTYRDVDSCKSKNNRRKQRNEEKVARLREKKVTQCIICISLCFYIYIFFIWTLFQHTNKKKYKTILGKMLIKGNQVYLFAVVKFSSKKYHIKAHLKIKGGGGDQNSQTWPSYSAGEWGFTGFLSFILSIHKPALSDHYCWCHCGFIL